jgi:dihydrofolate reductase
MVNIVYIATSLDGFIADSEGGIDWLNSISNPDDSDFGWSEFISGIDAILMGRNTFEKVLSFDYWPYKVPVFVLSNSLSRLPDTMTGKVELMSGNITEVTDQLNQQGFSNIYVDGGKLIQSFLAVDMIDEMIITTIPIVLGKGIPLFGSQDQSLTFLHKKTDLYHGSLVKSHYVRKR